MMLMMNFYTVDQDFIKTIGFEIVAGRDFNQSEADNNNFIINESAASFLGWDEPVGKWFEQNGVRGEIIGVIKDFNYKTIHTKIEPLILRIGDYNHHIILKLAKGDIRSTFEETRKNLAAVQSGSSFRCSLHR